MSTNDPNQPVAAAVPVPGPPLVVQQSFPEPRATTNPYIVMLRRSIDAVPGVELRTFSWRRALLDRYDVFHVHWPEILVNGRSRPRAWVRQALTAALLVKLRLLRIPIVSTVHNLELPDALSWVQRQLLQQFQRQTTLLVRINTSTELERGTEFVTIVHGHYRDWFADHPQPESIPGRLGYFGLIRRYKGVEALQRAFVGTPASWSLRIAGQPSDDDLAGRVTALAAADGRVRVSLAYISDAELVELVGESELIVLPYRDMHNSGGVLTSLSLDRPVLVPANDVNARLATEVGSGWVRQYQGELTCETLLEHLTELDRSPLPGRPDLSAREWSDAGRRHVDAYRRAIATLRRRPGG